MRRLVFVIFAWLFILTVHAQKQRSTSAKKITPALTAANNGGYNITAIVSPFKNCYVYLGSYYGKYKNIVDSTWFNDKSEGTFKGNTKLPGGIYFIVSPKKVILFEFLMDEQEQFSIKSDTAHADEVVITGSKENSLFQEYTKYLSKKIPQLNSEQALLKEAKTSADSSRIQTELKRLNNDLNGYRETIIKSNPGSMLALFFQSVKRPQIPDLKPGEPYPTQFVKEHFWDDVPFYDDRLLHTPFFEPKLDEYFKYYVSPEPDSIISEVNYMLLSAREGKEMFKYLLGKFTDKYINPEIMGQDKVFLFLFQNYYSKGDTAWLTAKQREYIFNRAYSLIANQIGEPAPVLDLIDTAGKHTPLYDLKAPFTIVVFWDPNCGHCKEEIPRVDSIFEAKWKAEGVQVYAVNVAEAALAEWKKFIEQHDLGDWIHVYQAKEQRTKEEAAGQPNYRQLYDVFQTPTMYLLDSSKHIIAKRLTLQQFDEVMQAKLKNQTTQK